MAYIGDNFEDILRQRPGSVALVSEGRRISWREFVGHVRLIEAYLSRKTQGGAKIALQITNPASLLASFFACARSGRVAMVLDPDWSEAQAQKVLNETTARCRLDDEAFGTIVSNCEKGPPGATTPDENDLFYSGFTSGSTGVPKGFVRSHRSWLKSFQITDTELVRGPVGCVVLPGRLSHSLHLYGAVHGLCRGIAVQLVSQFDPRPIVNGMREDTEGLALYATPTHLKLISEAAGRNGPVESVRLVFSSGAKWQADDRKSLSTVFPNARLIEFYGASETSFISWSSPEDPGPEGSVGRPLPEVDLAIGNPDSPNLAGVAGPIWVRSEMLFSRYICGTSPGTRWQGDWLTFCDHGYLDTQGFLTLTGRENRMIITSGLNVYPEEIETVLLSHPVVAEAVVVARPDDLRGERLEAVVRLVEDLKDPERILQRHCRQQVGAAKTPRKIHIWESIPLTAGGKPDIRRVTAELVSVLQKKG